MAIVIPKVSLSMHPRIIQMDDAETDVVYVRCARVHENAPTPAFLPENKIRASLQEEETVIPKVLPTHRTSTQTAVTFLHDRACAICGRIGGTFEENSR